MESERYRNISYATVGGFEAVLQHGKPVAVRGEVTREVLGRGTLIEKPYERFPFLPGRLGDPFALLAESLWVLAGRNDLEWLSHYLPRATQFSDDGCVWRAGYGPRLRNWKGVDQLREVYRLLADDRTSRRAVVTLFDPASDFENSRDIPCNNWLSWLVREGRLLLNVAMRSNDAMWGFSGINSFEWSVLQELLAGWLDVETGPAYFLASSFHIYERDGHLRRAAAVISQFPRTTPYELGVSTPRLSLAPAKFDTALSDWFEAEENVRLNPEKWPIGNEPSDPFLLAALRTIRLKWGAQIWNVERLRAELHACPDDDFTAAAYERLGRGWPELLSGIPQHGIRRYFELASRAGLSLDTLKAAVDQLHRRKNSGYGAAWKRRGERISILPNIARKIDRLDHFDTTGAALVGETTFDTAVDLLVYVLKYELYLAEQSPELAVALGLNGVTRPFSEFDEDFTTALYATTIDQEGNEAVQQELRHAVASFEDLWPRVERQDALTARIAAVARLRQHAERLVAALARAQPSVASAFMQQWATA